MMKIFEQLQWMLSKNLIRPLLVQDRKDGGSRDVLSRSSVRADARDGADYEGGAVARRRQNPNLSSSVSGEGRGLGRHQRWQQGHRRQARRRRLQLAEGATKQGRGARPAHCMRSSPGLACPGASGRARLGCAGTPGSLGSSPSCHCFAPVESLKDRRASRCCPTSAGFAACRADSCRANGSYAAAVSPGCEFLPPLASRASP